jgi:nitrite reductase (cytochrome c-552)
MVAAFAVGAGLAAGIVALMLNMQERKHEAEQRSMRVVQISENELNPKVWGHNFPHEYSSFLKTSEDTFRTTYGGSASYSKLERYPAMKRIWAGYAFAVEHNEERGHSYALTDQLNTRRVKVKKQPGACANCHSADAPQLIKEMGWEKFNSTPYDVIKARLHTGTSCADCHDPKTMDLRITRPAFRNAMAERGIDLAKATR